MEELLRILSEIDIVTREGYAMGNVKYGEYVNITERLNKANKLVNVTLGSVSKCECKCDCKKTDAEQSTTVTNIMGNTY